MSLVQERCLQHNAVDCIPCREMAARLKAARAAAEKMDVSGENRPDDGLCDHGNTPGACGECRAEAETGAEARSATRQGTAHQRIDHLEERVEHLERHANGDPPLGGSGIPSTEDLHRTRKLVDVLRADRNKLVDANRILNADRDLLRRVLDDLRQKRGRVAEERDQARRDLDHEKAEGLKLVAAGFATGKRLAEANGTIKILVDDVERLKSNGRVYRQQIADAERELALAREARREAKDREAQVNEAIAAYKQMNQLVDELRDLAQKYKTERDEAVAREAKEYKHHQTELAAAKKEEVFQRERANDAIQYSGKVIEELHAAQAQIADLHRVSAEATHAFTVQEIEDNRALYKDGRVTSWSVNFHENGIHFKVESVSRPGARQRFKLDPSMQNVTSLTRFADAIHEYVKEVLKGERPPSTYAALVEERDTLRAALAAHHAPTPLSFQTGTCIVCKELS